MTRRGFLASLTAIPVAVKALGQPKPEPPKKVTLDITKTTSPKVEAVSQGQVVAVALDPSNGGRVNVALTQDIYSIDLISGKLMYSNGTPIIRSMRCHGRIETGDFLCLTKSGLVRTVKNA